MSQNFLSIYGKSFNWAGFFLPKKIYVNCSKLYDFCRTLDNIADQNTNLETKKKDFREFKSSFDKKNLENSVIKNMWELIDEFNISTKIIDDLFNGIEFDLKEEVRVNSNKELYIYCYKVAGTVGLMMAKILGVKDKDALLQAIDLGIAMQLTNIARDVVEDAKRNRIYLVKEKGKKNAWGVDPLDLEAIKGNRDKDNEFFNKNNPKELYFLNIHHVVSKTIMYAEFFYNRAFYGIKKIPINLRFGIIVAKRLYEAIGVKAIGGKNWETMSQAYDDRHPYFLEERVYLNKFEKILETFLGVYDFIKLLLIKYDDSSMKYEHGLINEEINLNERI